MYKDIRNLRRWKGEGCFHGVFRPVWIFMIAAPQLSRWSPKGEPHCGLRVLFSVSIKIHQFRRGQRCLHAPGVDGVLGWQEDRNRS